jgi:ParB family chromosome partitioning protein
MPEISIKKLHPDKRNANQLVGESFEKLKAHIQRTGFYPSCVVRPHPTKSGHYVLVDGHHRVLALKELGYTAVDCQITSISEKEAGILLLTLNRLRGTDIPRKRAELVDSLLDTFSLETLATMLPESGAEIEGLLLMLKQDEAELERALKAQIEAEQKSLPVPFGFMVPADEAPLVEEALRLYQATSKADQAMAFVAMCRDVLAQKER